MTDRLICGGFLYGIIGKPYTGLPFFYTIPSARTGIFRASHYRDLPDKKDSERRTNFYVGMVKNDSR